VDDTPMSSVERVRGGSQLPWNLIIEGLWYGLIDWVTMFIFLYQPREGVGRFMW
jgi:hypothetical protein